MNSVPRLIFKLFNLFLTSYERLYISGVHPPSPALLKKVHNLNKFN